MLKPPQIRNNLLQHPHGHVIYTSYTSAFHFVFWDKFNLCNNCHRRQTMNSFLYSKHPVLPSLYNIKAPRRARATLRPAVLALAGAGLLGSTEAQLIQPEATAASHHYLTESKRITAGIRRNPHQIVFSDIRLALSSIGSRLTLVREVSSPT